MSRKGSNTIEFVNKVNEKHNFKYDYSKTVYTLSKNKIIVICPTHGEFSLRASHHLNGIGCNKCAIESRKINQCEFIEKSNKVHNYKYDYSFALYSGAKEKVKIICPIHGEFKQEASSHMRGFGCEQCGYKSQSDNINQFIEKAVKLHKDKYDYSLVKYKNTTTKIKIICNLCKETFLQTPNSHLNGHGCFKCRHTSTLNRTSWINLCNLKNKTPLVYIIRCYNNKEEFIKIGRTYRSIYKRFWSGMPYSYEIIKEIKGSPDFIYDKEHELHRKFRNHKYIPLIRFNGKTECFNISILQDILKH